VSPPRLEAPDFVGQNPPDDKLPGFVSHGRFQLLTNRVDGDAAVDTVAVMDYL
jgi:hypothetical protein